MSDRLPGKMFHRMSEYVSNYWSEFLSDINLKYQGIRQIDCKNVRQIESHCVYIYICQMSVGVEVWIALSILLFNFLFFFSYSLRPSSSLSLSLSLPPSCLTTVAFLELLWASSGYNIQSCALLRWHLREFLASSRSSWLRVKHKKTPSSCGGKPDPAQKWGSGLKTRFGNEKHSFILFSQSQASTGCQHMFAPFWVFECELCETIVYEYSMLKYMELLCG